MVVRAYDKSHRMMRSRKQRTFINQTISDIVKKICSENRLSAQVEPSGGKLDFVVQNSETDWDFIWRLAQRIGFEFIVDDTKAVFQRPDVSGEAVELTYPDDLHGFRPRITAVQQVATVNVRGFDLKSKQEVVSAKTRRSRSPRPGSPGRRSREVPRRRPRDRGPVVRVQRRGGGRSPRPMLDQLANAYLAAEGACEGNLRIKAGTKLKIKGVGRSSRAPTASPRPCTSLTARRLRHAVLQLRRRAHPARPVRRRQRRAREGSTRSSSAS